MLLLLKSLDQLPIGLVDSFYKQVGSNVKKMRVSRGISQLELSQLLEHKSVGLVSQAELYLDKQHFNMAHLLKIAFILECDICDFLKDFKS